MWENSQSELSEVWSIRHGPDTLTVAYLVHFLQTFISNFQPINHFPFDLGKLQVLNLE